ncbi:hypothetical protein AB7C87_07845 [Natrarchaeobius sp. A-rgal3]
MSFEESGSKHTVTRRSEIDWTQSRRPGWLDVDMGVSTVELRGWLSLLTPVSGMLNCFRELEKKNLLGERKMPVDSSRARFESIDG